MPAFISVCAFSAAWRRSRPEAQTTRIPKEFEFGLLNKKSCKGILWIIVPHLKRGIKEFCGRNFCSPKIRADNERANPPTEMGAGCPAPTLLMLLFPPLQVLLQFRDAAAHEAATTGTPMIMPGMPKRPPPRVMAKTTQKEDRPVELPRMAGPMMFPSICCRIMTKISM